MNRDLIINVLLIIAGMVLALLLFGAGAIWRSRMPAEPSKPFSTVSCCNQAFA